jgi:hypothetical protein
MSEGIWVYVFLIFCGMWMALIFVMIGVVIESVRMDGRCIKDVLHGNIDSRPGDDNRIRPGVGNDGRGK